jgi:enamine deaminase RidA (YjgF/YER057c/UK114 family)
MEAEPIRRIGRVPGGAAPLGPYVNVVVAGRDVHVAGQAPVDADGRTVGRGDMRAQALQAYRNLEGALAAAGCGWDAVLKLTVYLTDMGRLPEASAVRRELIGDDILPASTVLQVAALADPDWLVEIEAVARLPA